MFKGKIFIGRWSNYHDKVAPRWKSSQFHSCEGWDILQAIHFFLSDIDIPGTMNTMTFLCFLVWFVCFFSAGVWYRWCQRHHICFCGFLWCSYSVCSSSKCLRSSKKLNQARKQIHRKKKNVFLFLLEKNFWIKSGLIAGWQDPYIGYFTFTHYTFAFWCVLLRLDGKKKGHTLIYKPFSLYQEHLDTHIY